MPDEIREKLDVWVRQLEEYGEEIDNWSERNIQAYVVEPLLNKLGWDPFDRNIVQREVPVTMGRETKKADYVIISDNNNKCCVVETKAGGLTLDDEDARQSISYAIYLKCLWAIVMNGRNLCLYDVASFNDDNPMNSLVMEIEFLSDTQRRDDILNSLILLAKGRLDSENGRREILQLKSRRDLRKFVQDKKEVILNNVIPEWVQRQLEQDIDRTLLQNVVKEIFGEQPIIPPQPPPKIGPGGELQITTVSDWDYTPKLGKGVFTYKTDPNKKINVDCSTNELNKQLQKLGMRCSTRQALNGFIYNLREIAGLTKKRRY